jgi:parallel beta-helix repeat protein
LTPIFSCHVCSTNNILYVDDDGTADYKRIQDAIDNANANDTIYVFNGLYQENLKIYKPLFLMGENIASTVIYGSGGKKEIINISSNYVALENFRIQHNFSQDAKIRYDCLVRLNKVNNVSIVSNHFLSYYTDNIWSYIVMDCSNDCLIEKNNLNGSSSDDHDYNIWGICLSHSDHNIIRNNTINYHWESGITLSDSNYNIIVKNTISYTAWGIALDYSNKNNFKGNIVSFNEYEGFDLFNSSNNIIQHNEIGYNNGTGIYIFEGSKNNIINNNIILNKNYGIEITSNGFIWNLFISPELHRTASVCNTVSYNNFINNTKNACFESSYSTNWNMNYWGTPRQNPYPIFGRAGPFDILAFPMINFDWHPALKPYDITIK